MAYFNKDIIFRVFIIQKYLNKFWSKYICINILVIYLFRYYYFLNDVKTNKLFIEFFDEKMYYSYFYFNIFKSYLLKIKK